MYELKKIGKVFTSKFVGTGSSSYKKRIYRAAVSQRLRNTGLVGGNVCKAQVLPTSYPEDPSNRLRRRVVRYVIANVTASTFYSEDGRSISQRSSKYVYTAILQSAFS